LKGLAQLSDTLPEEVLPALPEGVFSVFGSLKGFAQLLNPLLESVFSALSLKRVDQLSYLGILVG
jgi:hypothetical protein